MFGSYITVVTFLKPRKHSRFTWFLIQDTTLKLVQQKSSESDGEEESEVDEDEDESDDQSDMEVDGRMIEKKDINFVETQAGNTNPLGEGVEQAPRDNIRGKYQNETGRKSTLVSSGQDPKLMPNGKEQSVKSKADTNTDSTTEKKNISNKTESKSSKVFENDDGESGDFFKQPPVRTLFCS